MQWSSGLKKAAATALDEQPETVFRDLSIPVLHGLLRLAIGEHHRHGASMMAATASPTPSL